MVVPIGGAEAGRGPGGCAHAWRAAARHPGTRTRRRRRRARRAARRRPRCRTCRTRATSPTWTAVRRPAAQPRALHGDAILAGAALAHHRPTRGGRHAGEHVVLVRRSDRWRRARPRRASSGSCGAQRADGEPVQHRQLLQHVLVPPRCAARPSWPRASPGWPARRTARRPAARPAGPTRQVGQLGRASPPRIRSAEPPVELDQAGAHPLGTIQAGAARAAIGGVRAA